MITPDALRALLNRYEAAETSIAEERLLKAALAEPGLPTEFAPYRQWFGGLQVLAKAEAITKAGPWDTAATAPAAAAPSPPAGHRSAALLPGPKEQSAATRRGPAPPQPSTPQPAPQPGTPPTLRVVHRKPASTTHWLRYAVAAMLIGILGFGASLLIGDQAPLGTLSVALPEAPTQIDWSKYEVTDPAEATRITRAALAQVSTSLRRGSELTAEELGRMESLQHLLNRKS